MTNTKNTPIEALERAFSLRVLRATASGRGAVALGWLRVVVAGARRLGPDVSVVTVRTSA